MVKQASSSSDGDEKKRKRMISNRESARRSRKRREQHIKDLNSELAFIMIKNKEIIQRIGTIERQFSEVNYENQKLARKRDDLTKRLESLEIVSSYVCGYEKESLHSIAQPWQLLHLPHQSLPLMASAGMFNF